MNTIARHLVPALLAVSTASLSLAGNLYVPFKDPSALPERQDVMWRGDQKHVKANPAFPDQTQEGVFHLQNVRSNYRSTEVPGATWEVEFSDVALQVAKAKDVSLVWSPFFPRRLAGHAAMLVRFEEGGAQFEGDTSGKPVEGIVISVEARMKDGEKYSFMKGLKGEFPLIYTVTTLENYRQRCLPVYKSEMHRWKLSLSPQEVRTVAQFAFETAMQDHRKGVYKLTRRSCSTEFMDMLIGGLKASQSAPELIADLEATVQYTRDADVSQVVAEGAVVSPKRRSFWRKFNPGYWLGMTRDHIRRTTPLGVFVNPLMSLPAQLPGVLGRRGLLENKEPYSIEKYQPTAEEIAAAQAKKKKQGFFKKLMSKAID